LSENKQVATGTGYRKGVGAKGQVSGEKKKKLPPLQAFMNKE